MAFARAKRKNCCRVFLETLEVRQLLSVVTVNPQDFLAAISASNPGDTISFSPGTYDLAPNSVPRLPGDRTYEGNGATLQSDGSAFIDLGYSENLTFTGFNLQGVNAKADYASNLNFNNNTISNADQEGFLTTGMTNSSIDNNTFTNLSAGVYGYPGNDNQVDNNDFDYVVEPIHFSCSSPTSGLDVSGNVITHATRIGIEIQQCISNITINNNYFADWLQQGTGDSDWHMAISCTTGGVNNGVNQGQNITVSGNTFLQTGPAQNVMVWAKSAIEIMGVNNINIYNNYSYDWGNLILDGAECTVNSSNNIVINGFVSSPDAVPWSVAGVNSNGDQTYPLNGGPSFPAEPISAGANASGQQSGSSSNSSNTSSSSSQNNSSSSNSSSSDTSNGGSQSSASTSSTSGNSSSPSNSSNGSGNSSSTSVTTAVAQSVSTTASNPGSSANSQPTAGVSPTAAVSSRTAVSGATPPPLSIADALTSDVAPQLPLSSTINTKTSSTTKTVSSSEVSHAKTTKPKKLAKAVKAHKTTKTKIASSAQAKASKPAKKKSA